MKLHNIDCNVQISNASSMQQFKIRRVNAWNLHPGVHHVSCNVIIRMCVRLNDIILFTTFLFSHSASYALQFTTMPHSKQIMSRSYSYIDAILRAIMSRAPSYGNVILKVNYIKITPLIWCHTESKLCQGHPVTICSEHIMSLTRR